MQTPELKNIYKWGQIVLIVLVAFLVVETLGGLKSLRNTDPAYNSITVNGMGEAFAVPDLATFSFSVSADADTVAGAQAQVTTKMDSILASLKDLGIDEKDIKTTDYSVYPKYVYNQIYCITVPCPGRQVQDGYTANHSVTVKVRNTDKAGEALSAAGDSGATNLSGISFTVDDPDQVTKEARDLAIKDARQKAKDLSKQLGVKLVRVVSYGDNTNGGYLPYGEAMGGDMRVSSAKAPTLPTGENKVSVSVSVTYEIR